MALGGECQASENETPLKSGSQLHAAGALRRRHASETLWLRDLLVLSRHPGLGFD
jgi:hypothetical protein